MRRRVPVVLQMGARECGAACLAMILRHHGREITLEECRERLSVGRDGSSAAAILAAARGYGLRARAFSASDPEDLRQGAPHRLGLGQTHDALARRIEVETVAARARHEYAQRRSVAPRPGYCWPRAAARDQAGLAAVGARDGPRPGPSR